MISACNRSGLPEQALSVYERMLSKEVKPSATTYTALISAYGKRGQVDKALDIFKDMMQRGCERNVITYSSLIGACEKAGRWELAIELFKKMLQENCRPNVVTYNSLIAACANGMAVVVAGKAQCLMYNLSQCYDFVLHLQDTSGLKHPIYLSIWWTKGAVLTVLLILLYSVHCHMVGHGQVHLRGFRKCSNKVSDRMLLHSMPF